MRRLGPRELAWALSVGVVLADSSIVTLALPEILSVYDSTVFGVSWVLTAFNLLLAVTVLPAATVARRRPRFVYAFGLAAFALCSLACALATSVEVLIIARCLQAVGGALVLAAAIELLASARGSHRAAAPIWAGAGTVGLAIGPAAGGALTELLSWESIFLLQVPLVLAVAAVLRLSPRPLHEHGPSGPSGRAPEVGLALISAGLTAALFLLVIMLTEGWGLTPLAAAVVVSAIPVATLIAGRLARGREALALAVAGTVALAGGLAALGLLPDAAPLATIPPQTLVGVGLALALPVLTAEALARSDPRGRRAAATIAARHAGIVVGIVVLTPVLSAQLSAEHDAAGRAGTALLLDAPLPPETKIAIGEAIGERIEAADGRLPDLSPAFAAVEVSGDDRPALEALEAEMAEEIDRAATHAFTLPFLGAALFALAALIPLVLIGRGGRR